MLERAWQVWIRGLAAVVAVGTLATSVVAAQSWATETVDGTGGSGFDSSLSFNPTTGFPAVAYSGKSGTKPTLKFAQWNGANWAIETVYSGKNGDLGSITLVFAGTGDPAVSFGDSGGVKLARRMGSTWTTETVDSKGGVPSMAYQGGQPWIAYNTTNALKLAHKVGSSWNIETVDGSGTSYLSLAFAPDSSPSIAYRSGTGTSTLKLARKSGSAWTIQSVATGTYYGIFASLAYDPITGYPTIAHSNGSDVRFHRFDGSGWVLESAATGVCSFSSLAYDAAGVAAISYAFFANNGYRQLRIARRTACSGACWEDELIEDVTPLVIQLRPSLAFGPTGAAAISYGVYSPQNLKFAAQAP